MLLYTKQLLRRIMKISFFYMFTVVSTLISVNILILRMEVGYRCICVSPCIQDAIVFTYLPCQKHVSKYTHHISSHDPISCWVIDLHDQSPSTDLSTLKKQDSSMNDYIISRKRRQSSLQLIISHWPSYFSSSSPHSNVNFGANIIILQGNAALSFCYRKITWRHSLRKVFHSFINI